MQWLHLPAPEGCGSSHLVRPLDSLALDKNIFVGSGLNLGVVDMLHLKTDETLIGMDKNQQGKYIAYLLRN